MLVKFNTSVATRRDGRVYVYSINQEYDLDDDVAQRFVAARQAVAVGGGGRQRRGKPGPAETKVTRPPETKTDQIEGD